MKKTIAFVALISLAACGDPTAPHSEHNGKPVYRASFASNFDDPKISLQEGYKSAKRSRAGWVWKECANGMKEISRTTGQTHVYPTAYTKQKVWMHTVLYQCK